MKKKASKNPRQFQFKIQVGDASVPIGSLPTSFQEKLTTAENGWLKEKEFSKEESQGELRFTTSTNEFPQVFLQMLEENEIATINSSESSSDKALKIAVAPEVTPLLNEKEVGPYHLQMAENTTQESVEATVESSSEEITKESSEEITTESTEKVTEDTNSSATAESTVENTEESSEIKNKNEDNKAVNTTASSVNQRSIIQTGRNAKNTRSLNLTQLTPQYTADNDEQGKKPKDGYSWIDGENVTNHLGYGNSQTAVWDNGNNNNNYINYGTDLSSPDFAIKKYAKEISQGLFDVTLTVKGSEMKDIQPIDIMLVVDWSGSMADNNRIIKVKEGVQSFVNTLDESAIKSKIRLGYIGYSSDNSSDYTNGTINLGNFDAVKNQVLNFTPANPKGGTFTQKALREAGNQLTDASRRRVIVLMTDGVPTHSYKVTQAERLPDGEIIGTNFSTNKDAPGNTSKLSSSYDVGSWPNRITIKDTFAATIGEAQLVKGQGIEIHGLGIQLGADGSYLSQSQVREKFKKMVSTSEDGNLLYYEDAEQASDISEYLTKKAIEISGTVVNGSIVDPIGNQYELVPNSVQVAASPIGVVVPNYKIEGKTIKVNNINLTKNQEAIITYQIRIKTEDANFKTNHWYPMNGETNFKPTPDSPSYPFGIPSGKATGVLLNIKKKWVGDSTIDRPNQLHFKISRNGPDWTSKATITLNKADYGNSSTWEKNNISQVTVNNQPVYLPRFNNQGQDFTYMVTEETTGVENYISTVDSATFPNYVFTNRLVSLEIRKVDSEGQLLKEASFTLTRPSEQTENLTTTNGKLLLKNLKVGEYTLKETVAPNGYELDTKTYQFKVNQDGSITNMKNLPLQEDATSKIWYGNIVNQQKPIQIKVKKVDAMTGQALKDVEFTLIPIVNGQEEEPIKKKTNAQGEISFDDLNWKKNYLLKESQALTGYENLDSQLTFSFNPNEGSGATTWTVSPSNNYVADYEINDYTITLKVKNQAITKLPETGGNSRMLFFLSGLTIIFIALGAFYLENKRVKN